MEKSGFLEKMGEGNVVENIDIALEKAREILAERNRE